MYRLTVQTRKREELIDITGMLRELRADEDMRDGAMLIFCPHTTAGLTVNETADPDVAKDIVTHLARLVPVRSGFLHGEGNSDAHIKTLLSGPHLMLIVDKGELRLGVWQGVYLCEWDGPRSRSVWVQFLRSAD